jgi:hypothetical protein
MLRRRVGFPRCGVRCCAAALDVVQWGGAGTRYRGARFGVAQCMPRRAVSGMPRRFFRGFAACPIDAPRGGVILICM